MNVEPKVSSTKHVHEAALGSLVVISPVPGELTWAIACAQKERDFHGVAILGRDPRILGPALLSSKKVLEIHDAVLLPDFGSMRFDDGPVGSLAVSSVGNFLVYPSPQDGNPSLHVNVVTGEIVAKLPDPRSAVWCTKWQIGFWQGDKFESLASFTSEEKTSETDDLRVIPARRIA